MLQMAQFVSFIGQASYHHVQSWMYPGMYPDGIDRVSGSAQLVLSWHSVSRVLYCRGSLGEWLEVHRVSTALVVWLRSADTCRLPPAGRGRKHRISSTSPLLHHHRSDATVMQSIYSSPLPLHAMIHVHLHQLTDNGNEVTKGAPCREGPLSL